MEGEQPLTAVSSKRKYLGEVLTLLCLATTMQVIQVIQASLEHVFDHIRPHRRGAHLSQATAVLFSWLFFSGPTQACTSHHCCSGPRPSTYDCQPVGHRLDRLACCTTRLHDVEALRNMTQILYFLAVPGCESCHPERSEHQMKASSWWELFCEPCTDMHRHSNMP